jgi:glycine betaine transporter
VKKTTASATSSILKNIFGINLDTAVFYGSSVLVMPFIVLGAFAPELFDSIGTAALSWIKSAWGWLYLSSVNVFVVISLVLALSPLGRIRLGKDDERPEYGRLSWFSMLFSAGMGIGLVFWSIAEPLYHFSGPPVGEPQSPESARLAMSIFFHHWGAHAWGTYVAVGLPLAYFHFRKGLPATISSCLLPFMGDESTGYDVAQMRFGQRSILKLIDILAVWATILGVVTSLGLGALQISRGLSISFGFTDGIWATGGVIVGITILFILSALSGVKRGIRYLSLMNVGIMFLLFFFFLIWGPFGYLCTTFFQATADYLTSIIPLSTTLALFNNKQWTGDWTIFYWAWWIAWAPFVGAFIAGISRGRTVREFIIVVMLFPPLFSFLFSTALGGTAIHMQLFDGVPLVEMVGKSIEATLFETLRHLPFSLVTVIVANLLITSFFITSADSATFVISSFSTAGKGTSNKKQSQALIIFWGTVLGGLALALIFSGGLKALQTASIVGALPFVFVIFFLLASVIRELIRETYGKKIKH